MKGYAYGILQLTPDQFWSMAWADFQDLLDGRLRWELRKLGVPEEPESLTDEEIADMKTRLAERAKAKGWIV